MLVHLRPEISVARLQRCNLSDCVKHALLSLLNLIRGELHLLDLIFKHLGLRLLLHLERADFLSDYFLALSSNRGVVLSELIVFALSTQLAILLGRL